MTANMVESRTMTHRCPSSRQDRWAAEAGTVGTEGSRGSIAAAASRQAVAAVPAVGRPLAQRLIVAGEGEIVRPFDLGE
jgi:hypothetical protein